MTAGGRRHARARIAAVLIAGFACAAWSQDPPPPAPRVLAPGVWLIPGSFPEDRNPDGNTVIFESKTGLVVMDTGRHRWHRRAILDFVAAERKPVVAIINSHWHLDHTSGNADIKALFPQARLHTGLAVERLIRDVWPQSLARSQALLDAGNLPPGQADDIRGDIETRRDPKALRPDVPVTASGPRTLDGLLLQLNFAAHGTTDGDVWVYEPRSRIAAAGDLVTLPVPFLDTACVKGWQRALADVAQAPFELLIPGHGEPMSRPQFASYRAAFDRYATCAQSSIDPKICAAGWAEDSAPLRMPEPKDDPRTREMATEYVELLRAHGGNARLCSQPG